MRGPRNFAKNRRRRSSRRLRPWAAWLAMAGCGIGIWWLGGVRPADDTVRASVTLPELGSGWDRLLDPLREVFVLDQVDFLGLERLDAGVLARALDLQQSALFDVDPGAACEVLQSAVPRIESCHAGRLPPDRLLVSVSERRPIARLRDARTGLDAQGVEFELAPDESERLPVISGERDAALEALLGALESELRVLSAHASRADHVALELEDHRRLLVGSDPARSFGRWRRLLAARALPEGSAALEIDTRFRGQVIVRPREPRSGLRPTPTIRKGE